MNVVSSLALVLIIISTGACSKKKTETVAIPSMGTSISFSNKAATSVTVTWGAATDDVTAAADLQYKVLISTTNNISTVTDAETNGTVKMDWTANTLTTNLTSLASVTTYYVTVLVKDADGNKAIDTTSTATLCSGKIMFLASVANGNLGGSAGADATCNSNKPTGFSGSTFKAMLGDGSTRAACWVSGTGNDTCTSSAVGRASWVFSASADICTSDYATRIGTTNSNSLLVVSNANSLGSATTSTFTGLNIAWGDSTSNSCSNWTSTAGTAVGGTANGVTSDNSFFAGSFPSCASAGTIYCVEQ